MKHIFNFKEIAQKELDKIRNSTRSYKPYDAIGGAVYDISIIGLYFRMYDNILTGHKARARVSYDKLCAHGHYMGPVAFYFNPTL